VYHYELLRTYDVVPAAVICLSSDTDDNDGHSHLSPLQSCTKRRAVAPLERAAGSAGANSRPRKERQPNWAAAEVMDLVHSKEKEHEMVKLAPDSRDLMERATKK
jgi:hypothetical protein